MRKKIGSEEKEVWEGGIVLVWELREVRWVSGLLAGAVCGSS